MRHNFGKRQASPNPARPVALLPPSLTPTSSWLSMQSHFLTPTSLTLLISVLDLMGIYYFHFYSLTDRANKIKNSALFNIYELSGVTDQIFSKFLIKHVRKI